MENLAIAGVPCIPRDNYFLGIILTRAAPADDVNRRKLRAVQLCDIPNVNHIGETELGDLNRKSFNFRCPHRRNAAVGCS